MLTLRRRQVFPSAILIVRLHINKRGPNVKDSSSWADDGRVQSVLINPHGILVPSHKELPSDEASASDSPSR
jgi:hypothetical protein